MYSCGWPFHISGVSLLIWMAERESSRAEAVPPVAMSGIPSLLGPAAATRVGPARHRRADARLPSRGEKKSTFSSHTWRLTAGEALTRLGFILGWYGARLGQPPSITTALFSRWWRVSWHRVPLLPGRGKPCDRSTLEALNVLLDFFFFLGSMFRVF